MSQIELLVPHVVYALIEAFAHCPIVFLNNLRQERIASHVVF